MIQDSGFRDLGLSAKEMKLQFLDLCGCKFISDPSLILICQNSPLLEYLNLTWCLSITDRAIVEGVAKFLSKLNLLSVYGLLEITDASFDALEQSPLKWTLETLDVNGCKEMSRGAAEEVRAAFPRVKTTIFHS
uniref:F-box/LRR-repeat protein 15-like leucin rich repeat domain-containing protein n=1 Tax=Strombidium rassoulzadegani TaxID=1082188 RepID=A0A7S3CJI8_9SPIT|mmetsp:Transcript_13323/g.22634  ORF Transcript_13323/g.22634 Transcript_13323/m.22634 type:complete len:134 (+) Transcript_13323:666-1067(+)